MCPACFEALTLWIVGMSSTGGVAALLARKFHSEMKEVAKDLLSTSNQEAGSCPQQHTSRSI